MFVQTYYDNPMNQNNYVIIVSSGSRGGGNIWLSSISIVDLLHMAICDSSMLGEGCIPLRSLDNSYKKVATEDVGLYVMFLPSPVYFLDSLLLIMVYICSTSESSNKDRFCEILSSRPPPQPPPA